MTRKRTPPPNYDYTATARGAAYRARAAKTLPRITLDATQAAALARIIDDTGETTSALVRRLLLDEAVRRGALVPPHE